MERAVYFVCFHLVIFRYFVLQAMEDVSACETPLSRSSTGGKTYFTRMNDERRKALDAVVC